MEFQIYTGESIAESLTALGLPSAFIDKTITCTTVKYHFNLENITKLPKVKKVAELLSATCHEPIKVLSSPIGHFCLEFTRKEREFPTFFETHSALKGKKDGEFVVGIDENGKILTKNIEDCPHLLVSGQTNSGKSVFLNSFISCINCYSAHTGLMLIDPKQVEFTQFENSPRLICPIITSVDEAIARLNQLCNIMDDRYAKLRSMGFQNNENNTFDKIICVIDELADLMLTSSKEVEEPIVRIAQKGRACGIHLVLATQRPTVNVVTGLIKANIPTRIAFSMASIRDSIVMLDKAGANELLGKGDCLVKFADRLDVIRVQAPYISKEDIAHTLTICKPRVWNTQPAQNQTTPKIATTSHKTSWLDKLLGKLGFDRSRTQRMRNSSISAPEPQVPYNIDEQNFFDCVDDDEEN